MSDFLTSLVLRARGEAAVVRPLARSLYGEQNAPTGEVWEETEPLRPAPPVGSGRAVAVLPELPPVPLPALTRLPPDSHLTVAEPVPDPADASAPRVGDLTVEVVERFNRERDTKAPGASGPLPATRSARPAAAALTPPVPTVAAPPPRPAQPTVDERLVERVRERPLVIREAPPEVDSADKSPATAVARPPVTPAVRPTRPRSIVPAVPGGRLAQPPAHPSNEPADHAVRISIGRVEVRAPAAPRPAAPAPQLAQPSLSLDDYLGKRDEELRR